MRHLTLLLWTLLFAGCPGRQYLDLDVASPGDRPLPGAVATAVCDRHEGTAARADRDGRARLSFVERERRRPCTVTVAHPDAETARFQIDRFCDHPDCRPLPVELGSER